MIFLNPEKPISTCESGDCGACPLKTVLHCHFDVKDLTHFLVIALPPFLVGGVGIGRVNGWWLIPWLAFVIGFFGFIEIRVMCSHCPHYAEPERSLMCWANYGMPKLWTYRPGPMTLLETAVFFGGFAIVWGYPLLFLVIDVQLFLLTVYVLTTIGLFMTLKTFLCSQCFNFACPLNSVDEETRRRFFDRNPSVGEAWRRTLKAEDA